MNDTQALTVVNEERFVAVNEKRFEMEQRLAKLFVASGLFSDIKGTTPEQAIAQAYVKIAIGGSMGFTPAESMQGIDLILGRPVVGSQLRAARMQRNGYSWRIDKLDNEGCELTIFSDGNEVGKSSFTEDDAKRANLLGKDNWKKSPSDMYFARAITRAQRRYAPGVLSADVLSREEIIDVEPESIIDVSSRSAAEATQTKTEQLKEKISAKKDAPKVNGGPIIVDTEPPPPTVMKTKESYADLPKWRKEILNYGSILGQEKFMAALATAKIYDINEINEVNHPAVVKSLREAEEHMKKTTTDMF